MRASGLDALANVTVQAGYSKQKLLYLETASSCQMLQKVQTQNIIPLQ